MRLIPLTDLDGHGDPSAPLDDYTRLTDVALRRVLDTERGLYLAESAKVVRRALDAGHRPRSLLLQEKFVPQAEELVGGLDVPVYVGSEELLEGLTGFRMHRGVLASMHRPELPSPESVIDGARTVLVLEDIVDHTNVGAAFRNAAGLGADAVLVTERCADPLYRRSVRVSMGTVLQVPWSRLPAWPQARELFAAAGFETAALALEPDAVPLGEYAAARPERVALLLGTEGHGLTRAAMRAADRSVIIPMHHGVDSLNVAATSGIALYALC